MYHGSHFSFLVHYKGSKGFTGTLLFQCSLLWFDGYFFKNFKCVYLKYFLHLYNYFYSFMSEFLFLSFCCCFCVHVFAWCLFAVGDSSYHGVDVLQCFVIFVGLFPFHGFIFLALSHFSFPLGQYLSSFNSAPKGPQIRSLFYTSSRERKLISTLCLVSNHLQFFGSLFTIHETVVTCMQPYTGKSSLYCFHLWMWKYSLQCPASCGIYAVCFSLRHWNLEPNCQL